MIEQAICTLRGTYSPLHSYPKIATRFFYLGALGRHTPTDVAQSSARIIPVPKNNELHAVPDPIEASEMWPRHIRRMTQTQYHVKHADKLQGVFTMQRSWQFGRGHVIFGQEMQ